MSLGDELLSQILPPTGSPAVMSGTPFLAPAQTPVPAARSAFAGLPTTEKPAIAKINYSHAAMADLIITNPGITQNEIARYFGYTAAWVSRIFGSDAFQNFLAERTKEVVDPTVKQALEDRFRGMLYRSLEILEHKLEHPPGDIPDNLALRTAELASKALGFGAQKTSVAVNINMENHLESLGGRLTGLLERKRSEAGITVEAELVNDAGD